MDLPNEIITRICMRMELRERDLCALRLTSKHLCELVLRRFAKQCFTEITVLMSRSSLRAFIDLAQHPYFGSFVKHITISPLFTPDDYVVPTAPSEVPENTEMTKLVAAYLVRSGKEHQLSTDRSFERMLSVVFKALAQREQCLQLRFCDDDCCDEIGTRDQFLHDEVVNRYLVWHLDWKTTFEQTIRAVTSHNCKVSGLAIDQYSRGNAAPKSIICIEGIEQQISSLSSQLSHLAIACCDDDPESTMQAVKRMVSIASNLKSLHLTGFDRWAHPRRHIQQILECIASTSLEDIMLYDFSMSEPELFGFLGRHSGTLQAVTLWGGCLTGSCMSLVAWVKDNIPGLKQFELFEVCQYHNHTICPDNERKSYWVGPENDMQVGLANILDRMREEEAKVEEADGTEQGEDEDEWD